jgi:3,8-divinyl chlorophyllide a/chlorophyllide a reductase subunit X
MPANVKKPGSANARMLAVYGKGGMGKSFFTTNLVAKLALIGNRVMQLGCDPKHDSCNALFGGVSLPTLGDTWRSFKDAGREDALQVSDVIFRTQIMGGQADVYGCELGGPEVGRGCGGRGITFGFDTLEKFGMSQWALDYVVMDFLGDVVCGGFATPLARSLAEEVIIVVGNDRQSLYAANNIARAAQYFVSMGGHSRVLGVVINRDDGSDVAARFAEQIGLPVLARIPLSRKIREMADACQLAVADPEFDALFEGLATMIVERRTPEVKQIRPLEYKEFLRVFGAEEPDIVPDGASSDELFGALARSVGAEKVVAPHVEDASMDQATRRVVGRLLRELGLYVTSADNDGKKGMTVTIDGNITACFGSEQDLDSKIAILAALRKSGESFTHIDLRRPAAPVYR